MKHVASVQVSRLRSCAAGRNGPAVPDSKTKGGDFMATNPPAGDGHRNGAVRDRSQVYNPQLERWIKRDTDTGRFIDQKVDGDPFKGVRKED